MVWIKPPQSLTMVAPAMYRITTIGIRDFSVFRRASTEKNLPRLVAGLKRLKFGIKALGLKTTPPCAVAPMSDTKKVAAIIGASQRAVVQSVQWKMGDLGFSSVVVAEWSSLDMRAPHSSSHDI